MLKKILLTFVGLIFAGTVAFAISGVQIGFPIANGPSYCGSTGNNGVCNLTVPAGPSITGNETILANTNSTGQPFAVLLNMASMNALPYTYVGSAAAANTTTLSNLTGTLILDPTTTIATYAVIFPAATTLTDGQTLAIAATHTITTLTLTAGTGTSLSNTSASTTIGATACTASTAPCGFKYIYSAPVTTWFRLQ